MTHRRRGCPTPEKTPYYDMATPGRAAYSNAVRLAKAGEPVPAFYLYDCPCGVMHLTRSPGSADGTRPNRLVLSLTESEVAFLRGGS